MYIATSSLKLQYVTSLIQGELELPASSEIEGITILLELVNDPDFHCGSQCKKEASFA